MVEISETLHLLETYDLLLVVVGLGVLALTTLLHRFDDYPFSFPILALALGYAAFSLPTGLVPPDPLDHGALVVHLTEIGVILSLMGVGLKIDRLPNWGTWSSTWRLLGICMPLTIAGVAGLGWWLLDLSPAAAVLLGAALAPTDPVLASDVQVGEPDTEINEDAAEEEEDELRFALTSEAGLNDSLGFPFTYLALLLLERGTAPSAWLADWLLLDVAYKMVVGIGTGIVLGRMLSRVLLRLPVETEREQMTAGMGALAATLLFYGITECLGGYGFLAVFVGALAMRGFERAHESHKSFHAFAEQSEQLIMTGTLIALGGALAGGLLAPLTLEAALVGILLIFVVRPAAGMIGLLGEKRLTWLDRSIAGFFGIRGIGCLYYLAYGLENGSFAEAELLWAVCAFTVALSVCVHGVTAAPIMRFRDRRACDHPGASR